MALPKEPRQKMINLMYLVLTALLALNVSSEILNAFKVVTKSLNNSNNNLTASSADIYASFAEALKDPKNSQKAQELKPKADSVKVETDALLKTIESFQSQIVSEAGTKPDGTIIKEDNLDIGTRIMEKEGGEKIFNAIQAYKANVKRIMGSYYGGAFPKGTPLEDSSITDYKTFVTKQFHMQPTLANITMFSKLMNDVKNTESKSVNHLFGQMSAVVVRLNNFVPLVSTSSTYLMPGEEMEVQAGMGAFNNDAKPSISINGQGVAVGPDGVATTKYKVNGSGSVNVVVNYVDPNTGKPGTLTKTIPYTVGQPSSATVSLDKMDVFYIGVDNPITISSPTGMDRTSVNGSGCTINGGGTSRTVTVSSPGTCTITVSPQGSAPYTHTYRIKKVPDPVFKVGSGKVRMPAVEFRNQGFCRADLGAEFPYDVRYSVIGAAVSFGGKGFDNFPTGSISSNDLGPIKALMAKCVPGSSVSFYNVKVTGPGGTREIEGQSIQLY